MKTLGIAIDSKMQTFTALGLVIAMSMLIMTTLACPSSSQILSTLEADLPVLEQQAQNIIQLADPGDAALAKQVSDGVNRGLKTVADAVAAYKANPSNATLQNVTAAIDAAAPDILGVLSGIKFSTPATLVIITAAVDGIVATLDVIAANLPQASSAASKNRALRLSVRRSPSRGKLPTPEELRGNWNSSVCSKNPQHCPAM